MVILGIDPGSRRIGYGVIRQEGRSARYLGAGLLRITSKEDAGALVETKAGIEDLIAEWEPGAIAIEKIYFVKNRSTGIQVAQARGVILSACTQSGVPVFEYTPNEVKAGLTGYGLADKKAMDKMVRLILNQPGLKLIDDAMDALGIALVASERLRLDPRFAA